jgi:hypothetical protein
MKWKANKSKPREGDIRIRKKFALFPVHYYINAEMYYCWLETYIVKEQYTKVAVNRGEGYYSRELKWKLVERKPLYWEHEV